MCLLIFARTVDRARLPGPAKYRSNAAGGPLPSAAESSAYYPGLFLRRMCGRGLPGVDESRDCDAEMSLTGQDRAAYSLHRSLVTSTSQLVSEV